MTDSEQQLVVGAINGVYGIKGWVKVYSYTSPIEQILQYQPWTLYKKGVDATSASSKQITLEIAEGKIQGKGVIVLPKGFETRNEAESLTGYEIRIAAEQLPSLPEGEFYWHELEGMCVINEAEEVLGEVVKMIETGANDVLVIRATENSIDDQERLIPLVMEQVVKRIDSDKQEIRVIWEKDY